MGSIGSAAEREGRSPAQDGRAARDRSIFFEHSLTTSEAFISPFAGELLAGNYDGRSLWEIFIEDGVVHHADVYAFAAACTHMHDGGETASVTLRLRTCDGRWRWHRIDLARFCGGAGRGRILGIITDVDAEKRAQECLQYRAEFDDVTGIYNRETFYLNTKRMLEKHPDESFCIVRVDIDRFKMINDIFGIAAGDRVLRHLAHLVRGRMRRGETYAHMRDDVFCMCLRRSDGEVDELVAGLEETLNRYPLAFRFVLSAGACRVARYQGEPVSVLCDRAALAQKAIKGSYVRRCAFYAESMSAALHREQNIVGRMQTAIEEGQFIIYLQPRVDMSSGKIFGAEALVRWQLPDGGLIPPAQFIPLFEKNGFIIQLDEYVWELVCRMLRRWLDMGLDPVPVSVNVSRVHLYNPGFCETFLRLMQQYRLEPRLLELELTESAYTDNPRLLYQTMELLQAQGFTFLMDDFGSGYSSLNMLKDIPVDILKIDLNFLRESEHSANGRIILESTILMAQRLDLPVIAEGVETAEQAAFLLSAGCTQAQGYYYSKPVPVAEFERMAYGLAGAGGKADE